MTNKLMKLGVFVVLMTLLAFGTAVSQVYVSATNGDDTFGTGSAAQPYRTIQKAITVAATGSTINVEAGIYNSTLLPGEGNPISLTVGKSLTFVGTAVGVNTTVELTAGFTLNHASAVADFGSTGTAKFNFGTTAAALVLTAGSMTSAAPANVVVGSGATLTFTAGTMNFVPTKGTNLNVIFNGTTAIASTSGFMPSSFGTGTLTISKASGAITIDNASLSLTNIVHSGAANATISGDLTVAANGDITNSSTGTLTVGTSASNALTMSTSEGGAAIVTVSGGGSVVVNSAFTYNVKNAATSSTSGDGSALTVGNIIALTGASNFTANANVTFNNTNVVSTRNPATGDPATQNAVAHNVTLSNGGTGALSIVGTISTPLSTAAFSSGVTNNAYVSVILSNSSTGSFSTRTAALRGATGTNGVINNAGGTMTLGQSGDTFSSGYDVVNDGATAVMTVNAAGTFTGTVTNNNAASQLVFTANSSVSKLVTNVGKIKLNATTLTLSFSGGAALNNTGDVYSTATATTGSGWLKFTGAAPTMTGTGPLPNVEIGSATSFSTAGNTFWGDLKTTGAGAVSIGGATVVKGNLDVNGTGTITINGATAVAGNVNMTSGNITLGTAGLTVTGTFTMPQGTFTFGANTLELKGNFVRTGGLIGATQAGTGTLLFSGSLSQSFTPGTQMNVYNVTVSNTGPYLANVIADDKITVGASLLVHNNFAITSGYVDLGINNIRMLQTTGSARFNNGGRGYTATGVGGLIFEGSGANPGGAGDGAVITGAQPYSNVYVRLSTPALNVYALGAVKISGVITFDAGGLIWNAPDDAGDLFSSSTLTLDDVLVIPTVVINTQNTHGSPFLVDGVDGGAVALAITSVYNLSYTGQTNTTIGATDFVSTKVRDLSIIAGTAGKTILFIAGNGTITGSLRVDNGETLDLNNGGARILTASGNTAAHTVNGTVTGGQFEITGTAASLTGGSGTGNASLVADLLVDPATSGTFTSTGMKALTVLTINRTGLVSTITFNTATASMTTFTNTAGTTTLNMNSTASAIAGNFTVTAGAVTLTMNGAAAGTRTIAGTLDVNGGTLTLGSHINVSGATSQAGDGSLILGDNNLTLADNYTHAGTGTVSAGTGAIVAAVGATKNYTFTTTVNFPNFTLNSPGFGIAFVTNGLTVTTKFVHTAGDLNLGTLPLTLAGNGYTFTAGTYTSGGAAGAVHLTGTAMVIDGTGNPSIPFVTLNSTGTVTLNPDNTTSPATARTLTASSGFTHTKGTLALGVNDVIITGGAYSYTAGTITTTTSSSVTATNTNIGEVVFNGGSLTPATGSTLSIPNVRFEAAGAATGTVAFTVANRFTFGKGNVTLGSAGRMTLSDGAVVVRVENTGTLSHAPTFANVVDVLYLNANLPATIVTGVELPTATTALRNLTVNVAIGTGASQTVQLSANATVNGTLSLTSGILDLTTSSKVLNVAVGATVVRQSAGSVNSALTPAGAYNLTYTGNGDFASSSNEWPSTATITTFTVSVGGTTTDRTLNLHASRTVGAFVLNCTTNGSGIDLSNAGTAYTLTVTGVSTLTKGIVKTTTVGGTLAVQGDVNAAGGSFGTTVQMSFTGSANQTITTPAGGATIGNVTINKTGTTPVPTVTIAGGNLGINGVMTFVNGLVATGSNVLILAAPAAPFQGFDRTGVTGSYLSHVVGSVRKTLANVGNIVGSTNERSEFPVGTSLYYRPAAITFKPQFGIPTIPNGVSITVRHEATKPTGTVGLPIVDGVTTGVSIARYADFYWNIVSNASIGNTRFDLELTATAYVDFDAIGNVRIIRRLGTATDVANAWSLQGNPAEYDNFIAGGVPTVVNVNSLGGVRPEGGIFTYGLKSTLFVQNPIGNITLPDGARTFTKSLVSPPLFGGTRGTVTLSATSANTAIATVTIANNVLTVKGLIPGSTTITINAIDSEVGQIGYSFTANVTGVTDVEVVEAVPTEFALSQNYPNPFNPSTTIKFALPTAAPVTLEIYNTLGVKVRTLIAGDMMAAKFHQITWNGTDESGSVVPSGMYLYRLVAGDFKASKKMMMLK